MLKRFFVYQFPAIAFAGIIFLVSSLPGERLPGGFWQLDKLAHLGEYAVFGFLLARAFYYCRHPAVRQRFVWLSLAVGVFYGLTDEFHQLFVANRVASVADFVSDALGVILGTALFFYYQKYAGGKKIS